MGVLVKSFGCAANKAEGEIMAGLLAKEKLLETDSSKADTIVLNVCTVKGTASALREIRLIAEQHPRKKLVIAGCITQDLAEKVRVLYPEASLLGTHHTPKILKVLGERKELLGFSEISKIGLPRARQNPVVGIVPISQGCLDACAFCSTRLVKGRLKSYPEEGILREVEIAVKEGCKEIWLTGQDTCCYGFDIGTDLPSLLERIVSLHGDFMVRLGMGNPRHIPKYLERLLAVYKNPKMFKFLHIPLQSGSDEVLKRMLRGHNVQVVREIVARFREEIPETTFSTDIIVGFPGETEEEFNETINVVRELRFDVINISRFSPRPGTRAYEMPQVQGGLAKERSRRLTSLYREISFENNKKWLGKECEVLIDEKGKHCTLIGRNAAYKPVVVKGNFRLGERIKVKIIGAEWSFLKGIVPGSGG